MLYRLCVLIFGLCVLQFVNFLGSFAFVEGRGIYVCGAFLRGESGEEGFLFRSRVFGAGGPLGGVVEMGGHLGRRRLLGVV